MTVDSQREATESGIQTMPPSHIRPAPSRRRIPEKYLPKSLSPEDRAKQRRSIEEQTDRPRVDYPERRSKWVVAFERKHGTPITNDRYINAHLLTHAGIRRVLDKGRGAYYSSGSRPNQTPESWARARLASVILGGPARDVDRDIWNRFSREEKLRRSKDPKIRKTPKTPKTKRTPKVRTIRKTKP